MAFTESQILSISKIVGVTPTFLDAHLTSLGTSLTAAVEAAVVVEIDRWESEGFGSKFVKIHPKESNFGVETNSTDAKADIKRNIAVLLELPGSLASSMSMGTLQIG